MRIYIKKNGAVEFSDNDTPRPLEREHAAILILDVEDNRVVSKKNVIEKAYSDLIEESRTLRESSTLSAWLISGHVDIERQIELVPLDQESGHLIECKLTLRPKKGEDDKAVPSIGFWLIEASGRGDNVDEAFTSAFRKLRGWIL